jgi:hypothetical protein
MLFGFRTFFFCKTLVLLSPYYIYASQLKRLVLVNEFDAATVTFNSYVYYPLYASLIQSDFDRTT